MVINKTKFPTKKFLICAFIMLYISSGKAQMVPDNTLGGESSRITPNVLINGKNGDLINGGARRDSNLFHSFSEFNITDGQKVYFGNPSGVQNILTRVTGGNASNILGTLGVDGAANLFLINPSGILFGKNASLDVRGSFVGTTANGIQFGNQGFFNATNPEVPPLLTINPSALLFNQINASASIQNNSTVPVGKDPSGFDTTGLRVPDGKSLLLVGGNVNMDGGRLNAFAGRIELGSLVEPATVALLQDGDNLNLRFPENVNRGSVSLINQAGIFVTGASGDIAVNAKNLEIFGGSFLSAGIGQGLGTPDTVAGDININATKEISVVGFGSQLLNLVSTEAKGHGGNININSGSLLLRDGSIVATSTFGEGNAGNVTLQAKSSVSLKNNSFVFSTVESGGVGKSGDININACKKFCLSFKFSNL